MHESKQYHVVISFDEYKDLLDWLDRWHDALPPWNEFKVIPPVN